LGSKDKVRKIKRKIETKCITPIRPSERD
jgi:hypothetical protein